MPVTIHDVKATVLTVPIVAMVITAIRIFERARTQKFGLDDAFALVSATLLLVFVVGVSVHQDNPTKQSRTTAIALYYLISENFYGVLWTTRLSILFSIVRLTPGHLMRRVMYGLAAAFFICWVILFAQVFWVCENQPSWKEISIPQCSLGADIAVAQIITDIFVDVSLIVLPGTLLWNVTVSRGHHIRLLSTLSTSITTTVVSLTHAYYILRVGGLEELISAIIEIAVSLMICNTTVVMTVIMRLTGLGGEDDSPGHKEVYAVSNYGTTSAFKTISLPHSSSMTKVSYNDEFAILHRKSPSLWGPDGGVYVTQEQISVVHLPSGKVSPVSDV